MVWGGHCHYKELCPPSVLPCLSPPPSASWWKPLPTQTRFATFFPMLGQAAKFTQAAFHSFCKGLKSWWRATCRRLRIRSARPYPRCSPEPEKSSDHAGMARDKRSHCSLRKALGRGGPSRRAVDAVKPMALFPGLRLQGGGPEGCGRSESGAG